LCHALEIAQRSNGVENPGEFCMLRDMALYKNSAFFWIDATSYIDSGSVENKFLHLCRLIEHCDSMVVHDTVDAFILGDERDPVPDSTKIVANVNITTGLDAAEESLSHFSSPLNVRMY